MQKCVQKASKPQSCFRIISFNTTKAKYKKTLFYFLNLDWQRSTQMKYNLVFSLIVFRCDFCFFLVRCKSTDNEHNIHIIMKTERRITM